MADALIVNTQISDQSGLDPLYLRGTSVPSRDPADFGGHSLRAGFVTSAAEKGSTADRIMDHTAHRSHAMVRVYTRRADAFSDHAGEGLL
jgi:integrase